MKDKYARTIDYLRISVTDLCNLRCMYCIPEIGIKKLRHEDILTLEEIERIAKKFVDLGITKIRLTGGEPLLRKNIIHLIANLGKIEKLKTLALTTNGLFLKKYANDLKNVGVKNINISLDTLNEEKFFSLTRGGCLKDVLEGIEEAKKVDF